jgi:hypothetical protein
MRKDGQPRAFLRVKLKDLYDQVQSGELSKSCFTAWIREYRYKHWGKGIDEGIDIEKQKEKYGVNWQYLTDDEIKEIVGSHGSGLGAYVRELFDKIEAKIKEKNER